MMDTRLITLGAEAQKKFGMLPGFSVMQVKTDMYPAILPIEDLNLIAPPHPRTDTVRLERFITGGHFYRVGYSRVANVLLVAVVYIAKTLGYEVQVAIKGNFGGSLDQE